MIKESIGKSMLRQKFLIIIIVILILIIGVLFVQKQNLKYTLFYQYQAVPDIYLMNTMTMVQGDLYGEVRGFVKFDNIGDQPKDFRQYCVIKPLDKYNAKSCQYYSVEDIFKIEYLAPRSLGVSEFVVVGDDEKTITIGDVKGNKYFIDKATKKVSAKDADGDRVTLITNDDAYQGFMKGWLKIE